MDILIVTPNINSVGGVERVLNLLSNYLIKNSNCNISILATNKSDVEIPYFQFDKRIKIIYNNEDKKFPQVKNKIDLLFYDMKIANRLYKLIKDIECDIILSTHMHINFPLLIANRKLKKKIVISEHGNYYTYSSKFNNLRRKILYKKADKFIVLNEPTKKKYSEYLNNVVSINNPNSFKTDRISSQLNKKIISAGRLSYEKGFDRLIEIFNCDKLKESDYTLHIYGDGEDKEHLIKKINEYKLNEKIYIHPFTDDIKEKMLESDIYILPSRTECFPMILLEAMECGLPCISFDIFGIDEIIKNNENGYIVEDSNFEEFRNKLIKLMNDDNKRIEISENAKKNALRFDINIIGEKYKKVFEDVVYNK